MSWITAPFAWLLKALYELTGSYGWAVILFGVVVNLIRGASAPTRGKPAKAQ